MDCCVEKWREAKKKGGTDEWMGFVHKDAAPQIKQNYFKSLALLHVYETFYWNWLALIFLMEHKCHRQYSSQYT